MKESIKSLFFETIVEAVIVKSIAALPFLGLPVVRQLYEFAVKRLMGIAYKELEVVVEFKIIDGRVEGELDEYNAATDAINTALENKQTTDEELKGLRDEYKNSLRNLISMRT